MKFFDALKNFWTDKKALNFYATLSPSFPHFQRFSQDSRLKGIRINSAMLDLDELSNELKILKKLKDPVDLYFDIKGKQLRIKEVFPFDDHLEITLNHPISVETPVVVLFKAASDAALLQRIDNGRLIFKGGPKFMVKAGESIHIRDESFRVHGPTFTDYEIQKIEKVKPYFNKYFLSYVESQKDVDRFRELVGRDAEIVLKIETREGLKYVAEEFVKSENVSLMAARGDLYVEVERPHNILDALKLIIEKDPLAFVGSRILLSVVREPIPECCDLLDLAWLYDVGYRNMLLCDELCLKENLLATAVNVLASFREAYDD